MEAVLEIPQTGREWQELREQQALSVDELSQLTGLQKSTLYRLEAGAHVTRSTKTLVLLALKAAVA
jgi:transcriptional regulator with XRE-family HTH domain